MTSPSRGEAGLARVLAIDGLTTLLRAREVGISSEQRERLELRTVDLTDQLLAHGASVVPKADTSGTGADLL